jgi:hypothetical protein
MMAAVDIGSRVYSFDDQKWFASVSRDTNPVHLDAIYARRAPAGKPIVHGMHFVAVGLELALRNRVIARIGHLKIKFIQTIGVDDWVTYYAEDRAQRGIRISACIGDALCATIDVIEHPDSPHSQVAAEDSTLSYQIGPVDQVETRETEFDQLMDLAGSISPRDDAEIEQRFPDLLKAIGHSRVSGLFVLSCVVGMLCPGLYSIFSAADLRLCDAGDGPLFAKVRSTDDRFRLVTQDVAGLGLAGTISAFVRVPPVVQPSLTDLRKLVRADEFKGYRALVVGGSRGLGEVAAKLISAGGGDVTLTYTIGESDALRVVEDIRAGAGRDACRSLKYDACTDDPTVLVRACQPVTHLLYFATNKIGERRRASIFDKSAFDRYSEIYVAAFARLLDAFLVSEHPNLKVLYPSSSAIEQPPAGFYEYAMAKVAGETLCQFLAREGRFTFSIPRYPRLLTDQTATVVPTRTASVAEVVLASIRDMDRDKASEV